MEIKQAIRTRKSVRKFLNRPVLRELLEGVLDAAKWVPSGGNCQPWRVEVATGHTKEQLTESILSAREQGEKESPDLDYYPRSWISPYKERRFECGVGLYKALGIRRGDSEGRKAAWFENYHFFGAPAGLFFFMPRELGTGYLIDMGIFIQTVALAAVDVGLSTCIQASLAEYPAIVREHLNIPEEFLLVCGMSMGYEDENAVVNTFRTTRAPLKEFVTWHE